MTERFTGAKLVVTCGDAVLTLRRDDIPTIAWPGMWDLPGGGREGDETPQTCALRELFEETGLSLPPDRLLRATARPAVLKPDRIGWYFRVDLTPEEATTARLGHEGAELRLMPVAEFLHHPKAIPQFQALVAEMLDLSAPSA